MLLVVSDFFMQNGWIKLHRKVAEKGFYKKSQYFHLWIHLLLFCNHEPKEFMWNGNIILIKEGQMLTGRKELSEHTGIPESTVEDILKFLESQHQIQQQKTTKYRLITIVNWIKHQNSDKKSNNRATTEQQQADTNKNVRIKELKKNTYMSTKVDFQLFWDLYPKKVNRKKCQELWRKLSFEVQQQILKDIPLRVADDKWKAGFIKDPERYLKHEQWNDEIVSKIVENKTHKI